MNERFDILKGAPSLMRAVGRLDAAVSESSIDPQLAHLVKLRAS